MRKIDETRITASKLKLFPFDQSIRLRSQHECGQFSAGDKELGRIQILGEKISCAQTKFAAAAFKAPAKEIKE